MTAIVNIWFKITAIFEIAFGGLSALRFFDDSKSSVEQSFLAMLLVLPMELADKIQGWAMIPGSDPIETTARVQALFQDGAAALVSWLLFLVVTFEVCRLLGHGARWPRLVCTWNWSQVAQGAIALAANLPGISGAPIGVVEFTLLAGFAWLMWFDWKIIRLTLLSSPIETLMLVVLDVVISNLVPLGADKLRTLLALG